LLVFLAKYKPILIASSGRAKGVVHPAGTGFMENTGHVHNVRNERTDPLELVALFILPPGAKARIDMPNPGNCPF
jgi:hypothetical protein